MDRDVRPGIVQPFGDDRAYSSCGTGDEYDFSVERSISIERTMAVSILGTVGRSVRRPVGWPVKSSMAFTVRIWRMRHR